MSVAGTDWEYLEDVSVNRGRMKNAEIEIPCGVLGKRCATLPSGKPLRPPLPLRPSLPLRVPNKISYKKEQGRGTVAKGPSSVKRRSAHVKTCANGKRCGKACISVRKTCRK
jgi:hypothetical protein